MKIGVVTQQYNINTQKAILFEKNVTVHTLLIRYSKNDEIKKTFFLPEK